MCIFEQTKTIKAMKFRFESPEFEQAKEKIRKEYNRITIKSTGELEIVKDEQGNYKIKKKSK